MPQIQVARHVRVEIYADMNLTVFFDRNYHLRSNQKRYCPLSIYWMSTHKILSKECWGMNCHVVRSNLQPRLHNVHISIQFKWSLCDKPGFRPAWCSLRSRRGSGMWACCTWPPRTAAPAPCGPSPPAPLSLSRRHSSAGRGQAHRGLSDSEGPSWTSGGNDSTLAWNQMLLVFRVNASVSFDGCSELHKTRILMIAGETTSALWESCNGEADIQVYCHTAENITFTFCFIYLFFKIPL